MLNGLCFAIINIVISTTSLVIVLLVYLWTVVFASCKMSAAKFKSRASCKIWLVICGIDFMHRTMTAFMIISNVRWKHCSLAP